MIGATLVAVSYRITYKRCVRRSLWDCIRHTHTALCHTDAPALRRLVNYYDNRGRRSHTQSAAPHRATVLYSLMSVQLYRGYCLGYTVADYELCSANCKQYCTRYTAHPTVQVRS